MHEADITEKLRRLEHTSDDFERNHVAMDLSETGDARVFDALLRLIRRPELENYRGTLVYCLEKFDYSSVPDLLADLVATGNFEVALHAGIVLEQTAISAETAQRLGERLKNVRNDDSQLDWRKDMLDDAIAALS